MPKGVPNNPRPTGAIKAASMSFREMLADGGLRPSGLLLMRMRNHPSAMDPGRADCVHEFKYDRQTRGDHCINCGAEQRIGMPERVMIADKAIQYELPRLAAIEAVIDNVGKTHEDWVREFATDEVVDEDHTLQ